MESKKIVLIGGGGHCRSVLDTVYRSGAFTDILITDHSLEAGTSILGCKVAGTDDILPELLRSGFEYAFITVGTIGDNRVRKMLAKRASELGFLFPVIIDPSAQVGKSAQVKEGTFIGKNAVVNADAKIGKHCIINTGAIIEHECEVGDFTHVSVGSIMCGSSRIKEESFIGAGTTVIQGISIGRNVIVGANSTVIKNVEDNMMVYGIVKKMHGD